jgi:hypothetical protein
MKVLPHGRKQWLYFGLRFGILIVALALGAGIMTVMPGRSYSGPFGPLSDDERTVRDNIYRHISILAGSIGERNMARYSELQQAAHYIRSSFEEEGYVVGEQRDFSAKGAVGNLFTEIKGRDDSTATLIVGAHYDSARGSPGANDNATGVAALLELARLLKSSSPRLRIQFVAFVNEEPPYFQTESMGSRRYAVMASKLNQKIAGMVSLETLGCYYSAPGSQQYPFGVGLFYPSRADFVGFVGNLASRAMVRRSIDAFRRSEHFPSQGITAPEWFTGVGWSDHWSFWKQGIPAIMITDTALFRYPFYHSSNDTPDKVDCERAARVVSGIAHVIIELAR